MPSENAAGEGPLLAELEADAVLRGIAFKTGPPRRVGVELEWLVHDVHEPRRPVAPGRLSAAFERPVLEDSIHLGLGDSGFLSGHRKIKRPGTRPHPRSAAEALMPEARVRHQVGWILEASAEAVHHVDVGSPERVRGAGVRVVLADLCQCSRRPQAARGQLD